MTARLRKTVFSPGRVNGASPSENRYYILVFYDISDQKKCRLLVRLLKQYGERIQQSVFEAYMKNSQIKELAIRLERLMTSERFWNPDDRLRLYRIAGNCEAVVFGECKDILGENNVFV